MKKLGKFIFIFGFVALATSLLFGDFNPSIALGQSTPSVDLKINGQDGSVTIPYNASVLLSWTTENVNSCRASGDWSGVRSLNGAQSPSRITSAKTFTLTCDGVSDSVSVIPTDTPTQPPNNPQTPSNPQGPLPTIDLDAQPRTIEKGETSTISWSVSNAKKCLASGGWSGTKSATSGIKSIRPQHLTLYTLTCSNNFGSVSAHVNVLLRNTIEPKPTIDIKIQPVQIHKGEDAVILWNTTNADRCNAVGGWSGRKSDSGAETITATQNTIYTLICTNDDGSTSQSQTLFIKEANTNQPPTKTNFTASCVASPSRAIVGQRISFTGAQTSGETPVSYKWSGDVGGSSQLQSTVFTSIGTKRASVTITDAQGVTRQTSCSVVVVPAPVVGAPTRPASPPTATTQPRALEILSYESITNIDTSGIKPLLASIARGIGKILWYMFLALVNIALIFLLLYLAGKLKENLKPLTPAEQDEN